MELFFRFARSTLDTERQYDSEQKGHEQMCCNLEWQGSHWGKHPSVDMFSPFHRPPLDIALYPLILIHMRSIPSILSHIGFEREDNYTCMPKGTQVFCRAVAPRVRTRGVDMKMRGKRYS